MYNDMTKVANIFFFISFMLLVFSPLVIPFSTTMAAIVITSAISFTIAGMIVVLVKTIFGDGESDE